MDHHPIIQRLQPVFGVLCFQAKNRHPLSIVAIYYLNIGSHRPESITVWGTILLIEQNIILFIEFMLSFSISLKKILLWIFQIQPVNQTWGDSLEYYGSINIVLVDTIVKYCFVDYRNVQDAELTESHHSWNLWSEFRKFTPLFFCV